MLARASALPIGDILLLELLPSFTVYQCTDFSVACINASKKLCMLFATLILENIPSINKICQFD